jgi:hypothetical protein
VTRARAATARAARACRSASRSVVLTAALALLSPSSARAQEPPPALRATLVCSPAGEVGRVRCEVEATVTGAQLRWADVELTSVPEHIAPLKGRIAPRDATLKEPGLWRFALALVAKRPGSGAVTARVRAVACVPSGVCVPLVAAARGEVRVGG